MHASAPEGYRGLISLRGAVFRLYVNDVPVLIQGHLATLRAVLLVTFAGTAERVAVEGTVVIWAFEVFVSAGRLCCGPVAHVLGLLSVVGSSTVSGRIRHVKSIWQRVPRVQLRTSKQAAPAAAGGRQLRINFLKLEDAGLLAKSLQCVQVGLAGCVVSDSSDVTLISREG